MFNLEEEKKNKEVCFGRARKPRMLCFISDVVIRGIYLSLTLGTAKFKQLVESYSLEDLSCKLKLLSPNYLTSCMK